MKKEQNFDEVVKMIEESNKKVDEVLKAAKLQRHERQPMKTERLQMILNYIVGILAIFMISAAVFMIIYFLGTSGR